ncbi:MAG: hypothetical protein FVQ81_09270 [Candidatus Glassbacteria bacterium]|nr:hypothetical protein [Candidatus Glassbacteria bacterium]
MGKSIYRARTTYFLVTTNGNLRKISPALVGIAVALLLSAVVLLAGKCVTYNRQLNTERSLIQSELTRMEFRHEQIEQNLAVCEENKQKIASLLNFNTEAESSSDEE